MSSITVSNAAQITSLCAAGFPNGMDNLVFDFRTNGNTVPGNLPKLARVFHRGLGSLPTIILQHLTPSTSASSPATSIIAKFLLDIMNSSTVRTLHIRAIVYRPSENNNVMRRLWVRKAD
ncbi:hypothetical protein L198_07658 [Cryptococcus wingfieldii CBS 7118]|uniref:Uncharacterized protein n=1 Tax=Cryptococcus wingfieldii CBS 7118 TaxID=1295528 RepID=A0A1E3I5S6_9TREE|nr:hypothetical protein L198_07658 [Cryptococcus wingfieldii CBS 7118]ODN83959.1 hypothetical protein L198_07658 [Cryptococcus wingfieldii CBS 7118]